MITNLIDELLVIVENNKQLRECRYISANFVQTIASIIRMHGVGATKTYLWQKKLNSKNLRYQASMVLSVIQDIQDSGYEVPKNVMALIIEKLIAIKTAPFIYRPIAK